MKKGCILLATTALTACATSAHAAGINLSWDDCGSFGTSSRTFACDTNVGTHVLFGSFVASAGIVAMTGNAVVIDVMSACPTYSDWWNIGSGTGRCRTAASLVSDFNFTGGPGNCFDYWQGGAIGGITMDLPSGRFTRIKLQCALPFGDTRIGPVPEGTEVYSFKAIINSAKTVGLGACQGCQAGMCLLLSSILVTQTPGTPGGNITLANPDPRNFVTWQSGQILFTHGGPVCTGDCPTPALNRTWGQIKSLYR